MTAASATRILVAEDDDLLAELIVFKLSREGFAVDQVADGEDALAMIRERRPDAVLLDGMLPGMDGFDVLRSLKEDPETRGIPVMMLTGRRLEKDVVSGLQLGADEYLVKPFMLEELMTRLRRLLPPSAREALA
ncbi:response regulator receiver [Caenispirillum salinarum AK4]|uniref:Response regulator receiver n=1 Tax=Caenispirillum salinarum AK4 TaxID=1238182 RepID=K9HH80_9PROT|nr:response regulator [Caenispirillum salinarum]EKV29783.1 response regulator receiver [Caenispirillum salinarum AK4]